MKQLYTILIFMGIVASAAAQTLQSVNPGTGTQGTQSLLVEITGSNLSFNQGTSTQVIFSNQTTGFEIPGYYFSSTGSSAVYSTIDIPYSADTGLYDLYIKDDVNFLTLNNAFRVLAQAPVTPTMVISPNSGSQNNNVTVSVTGHLTHFTDNVSFYIQLPGSSSFLDGQLIQVTNDSSAQVFFSLFVQPGVYNFYAQDSRDNIVLAVNQFVVNGNIAQIVSASPDSGAANTTLDVNISGLNTNFTSATTTESVWLDKDGFIIYPLQAVAATDLLLTTQFSIPANAPDGWYDIHTLDPIDGELVRHNGFYIYDGVSGLQTVNADIVALQLFPNPAAEQLILMPDMQCEQWVSLSITDMAGQIVTRKRVFVPAGKSQVSLDVSLLAGGIYTVNLSTQRQMLHNRFVVAH